MADNVTRDLARMVYNSALSQSRTGVISFSDAIAKIKSRLEQTKAIINQLQSAQQDYERLYKELDDYMNKGSRQQYFDSNGIFAQIQANMNSHFEYHEEENEYNGKEYIYTTQKMTRRLFDFETKTGNLPSTYQQQQIVAKANQLAKAYDTLYNVTMKGMHIMRVNGEDIRGDKVLYHLGMSGTFYDSSSKGAQQLRELLITGETWEKMEHQRGMFEISYNPRDKEHPGLNLRVTSAGQERIQTQYKMATGEDLDLSKFFAKDRMINTGGGNNVSRQRVWELLWKTQIPTETSILQYPNNQQKWSYLQPADKFELLNSGIFDKAVDEKEVLSIIQNKQQTGVAHDSSFGQARGDTMLQTQQQRWASQEKYSGKGGGFNIIDLKSLAMGLIFYTSNTFFENANNAKADNRGWDELSPQEQEQFINDTLGDFSDETGSNSGLEEYAYTMVNEELNSEIL